MSLIEEKSAMPLNVVGPRYALKKLKEWRGEGPTERNKGIARFLVNRERFPENASMLMDLALEWEDLEIWQEVVEKGLNEGRAPRPSLDMLIRAWGIFTFDRIKYMLVHSTLAPSLVSLAHVLPRLGIILRGRLSTTVAVGLINDLQTRVAGQDQNAKAWLKQQVTVVLSKIRSRPTVADVEMYVGVAKSAGLPFFSKTYVSK